MVVAYEVSDGVAVVTIVRPERRNAMSPEVFTALHDAARRAGEADDVGAVLVRGRDGVFSAGIDLASLVPPEDGEGLDPAWVAELQAAFTAYEDLDVPTLAQVEGYCFGAGLQLALACHVRLVAPGAELSLMETRWGIVPDLGGTYRLPRLVGLGRATELAMTARRVDAQEALAIGLCEVALPEQGPADAAFDLARRLAQGPGAVRRVPRLVRENLDRSRAEALRHEAATQAEVTAGPDFREAVTAGREGRSPVFVGR